MAILETLKSYLKDLKYPGIDLMSDDNIANVFDKENRQHFLTWFVKQLDPDIIIPTDEKNRINMLADTLYDNGFCTRQTSDKFVRSNLELQPQEQVKIFNRMLSNLQMLIPTAKTTNTYDIDYVGQIKICKKLDVNIFPTLGPLKCRKPEERRQKLEEYDKEILQLKQEILCLNREFSTDEVDIDITEASHKINLQNEIIDLLSNSSSLSIKINEQYRNNFGETFEKVTGDSAKNMSTLLTLYENKKLISEFPAPMNEEEKAQGDGAISEAIKNAAIFSEEILTIN